MHRLGDKKHAPSNKDYVPPGNTHSVDIEKWCGESNEPSERSKHHDAEYERERKADSASLTRPVVFKRGRQQGNKNEIIDPEYDFESAQADERRPSLRIC